MSIGGRWKTHSRSDREKEKHSTGFDDDDDSTRSWYKSAWVEWGALSPLLSGIRDL